MIIQLSRLSYLLMIGIIHEYWTMDIIHDNPSTLILKTATIMEKV